MPTTIGTQNDDVLTGTALDDVIEDTWGDDVIDGGDGNDTIIDRGGSNTIFGGAGNDFIRLTATDYGATAYEGLVRTNLIDAGDGADIVEVYNYGQQSLAIGLGAGADLLTFQTVGWGVSATITTGAGADRIVFDVAAGDALRSIDPAPYVITDFTAGAGGDILDIGGAIERLLAWNPHAENPFASGHLVLVQDGADVIVRIDIDGTEGAGSSGWYDREIFRLENVNLSELTAYNFAGYAPDGNALVHNIVNGTNMSEWLKADIGGSDLNGLGGNDRLIGSFRNDVLNGGAENDILDGGFGDDILLGGDGDDVLLDPSGAEMSPRGGAGNDTIDIFRPSDVGNVHAVTILGGTGDDFVRFKSHDTASLTVDLGAGNDWFEIVRHVDALQLTLGAGQDRIVFDEMYFTNAGDNPAALVIADFAAGNTGDVLALDRIILSGGWDGTTNPFATGHLKLEQLGADTRVIYDYDGAGSGSVLYTVAVLANIAANSLTAFNFGGFAPNGSPSSFNIVAGTSGNDHLYGSNGSDIINGGDGNDLIEERKGGSDTLTGGAGDDRIILSRYDAFLPGSGSSVVTIDSGTGRDTVELGWSNGQVSVNLGADDDRVVIYGLPPSTTSLTLGTGSDIIELAPDSASTGTWPLLVTDFQTGPGGDRLDWAMYVEQKTMNGDPDYNPFYYGNARLVQVGSDVQLQIISYDNHLSDPLFTTVMTFQNTNVAAFTADNLGYDPFHPTTTGGSGDDALAGTAGSDVVYGNGGNDQLNGLDGDDVLWAHEGADTLNGGNGIDLLRGGAGDDLLHGDGGADDLDGGAGIDTVDGGDGDDLIVDWIGADTIIGGAGDDTINVYLGHDSFAPTLGTLDAGDGNDVVEIGNSYWRTDYSVDLGAGDDIIRMVHHTGEITLGLGRDTVIWASSYNLLANGQLVLSDFAAGDTGDVFDVMAFLDGPLGLGSQGFPPGVNPFALGHVKLQQDGSDVVMYLHREGYDAVEYTNPPVVRFQNTDLSQLTAANFGGFDPHVTPNWTTVLYDDLTIAAGEVREAVNVTDVNGVSAAFMFGFGVSADLVNHGTITSRVEPGSYAGSATGIYGGPAPASLTFFNASDGHIFVHSEWIDEVGSINFGKTYGVYGGVSFQNDGEFEVTAASGIAYGHYSDAPFTNNGRFTVTSPYEAYGVFSFNAGTFVNTGSITVHGGEYAMGVYWGDITGSGFNNAGTITVTTDPTSPYNSIGVYLGGRSDFVYHHYNSGTIAADIAVYADAWIRTGPGAYEIVDYLHNSGTINGAVMLAAGNDIIDNSGTMSGRTLLEDGNDQYNGSGGRHDGTVEGGAGQDTLIGGLYGDTFYGDDGNDTLTGNKGDDFLEGGAGDDMLNGGAGFDLASYAEATAGVSVSLALAGPQNTGGAGIDTLVSIEDLLGSAYNDQLTGNSVGNILLGGDGADFLTGEAGDDWLDGGAGADQMTGGAGDDTYIVDDVGDQVIELSSTHGVDLVLSSVSFTLGTRVDNLTLTGGAALDGTGNAGANTLTGNAAANVLSGEGGVDQLFGNGGNDTLDGGSGADQMTGGAGDDIYIVSNAGDQAIELSSTHGVDLVLSSVSFTLGAGVDNLTLTGLNAVKGTGNAAANILIGNAAANVLNGRFGADQMAGGGGNDTYVVDHVGDQVTEAAFEGSDLVQSSISYSLGANVENLTLTGTAVIDGTGNGDANVLVGNAAANTLDGGAGADLMKGGAGNDIYIVDNAGDQVIELASTHGIDLVLSSVSFTLGTRVDNLTLTGGAATNGTGNAGANTLTGNGAANVLNGSGGNDTLDGGGGRDTLSGGSGADAFRFQDGGFAGLTTATCDVIADFSQVQGDIIRLDGVDANSGLGGDQGFAFIGTGAFSGAAGELRTEQIDGNTYVQGDTNGDFIADFLIRLDGLHALQATDFGL